MTASVYASNLEPGCYVDGHHGQYAGDRAAELAMDLGWSPAFQEDPRCYRYFADMYDIDMIWEGYHTAVDGVTEWLQAVTDLEHFWHWHEGELFLTNIDDMKDWM